MATVDEIRPDEDGVATTGRKRWPPEEDNRGLECRHCGCKHFHVIGSRPAVGGRIVCRRECRHCGKQTTTWEKAAR